MYINEKDNPVHNADELTKVKLFFKKNELINHYYYCYYCYYHCLLIDSCDRIIDFKNIRTKNLISIGIRINMAA